jgi:glycerol kinase
MTRHILALDQGTTSTRALLFSYEGSAPRLLATAQIPLPQHFPHQGWVEHEAEEIWQHAQSVCREVLAKAGVHASEVAALGLTNQRETTVLWDRATGQPLHRALVWQDRRTPTAVRGYAKREMSRG